MQGGPRCGKGFEVPPPVKILSILCHFSVSLFLFILLSILFSLSVYILFFIHLLFLFLLSSFSSILLSLLILLITSFYVFLSLNFPLSTSFTRVGKIHGKETLSQA